jgi:peptidyl-prolyl cis-trans isomerase SurA
MKRLLFGLLLALNFTAFAQTSAKEVLFTIDDKPYYTDEFLRVYNKNLDLVKDESQKDLNHYLDLFVGYKLKINKANKLGLQNGSQYQNELSTYRAQLAKNYLTDSKVTKELVDEAYARSLKEIRASHILITVDENAKPQDTLAAYKKAVDIRSKAVAGQDFGALATEFSQDPSAKENKGDLGYFSAFRMVYAFESAAYKTPKGQVSMPVRTRFGYHLIKVDDIRDNRGEVTVAHIMILNPKAEDATAKTADVRATIMDIHKKLQQGENFETLARQFSEDKSSSSNGGVLNRFGSGQLSSEEFENVAFSLTKANPVSEPFQSQFGWHIVKLIERHPVKTASEMQSELENKISRDERSRLIAESLNEKLRKKYPIKRDDKLYAAVAKSVTDNIYKAEWKAPDGKQFDGKLFAVSGKPVTGREFLNYIEGQQKGGLTTTPTTKLVDNLYTNFVDEQLNQHYNNNLESEFPEFAAVMDEYRDGLLLFDLMEKEIWEKSKTDSIGLKNFFEKNINQYNWKNRADIIIVSSTKEDMIKKAQKLLKQNQSAEAIKTKLNIKGVVNVMTNAGIFEEGNDVLPKGQKFEAGVSGILKEGEYFFVTKVHKVLPAGPKTLEEAKGRAINNYQQYLEDNWVTDLKKEFRVSVNPVVFDKVKKQIQP